MDKVKEACEKLERFIDPRPASPIEREMRMLISALMLVVHVDSCERRGKVKDYSDQPKHYHDCGDGWFCERVKALKELNG